MFFGRRVMIGLTAAMIFAGTSVAAVAQNWTATLSDPNNPIWQQMPGTHQSNMPLTFQQTVWLISQYDHFVIQPLRDRVSSLESRPNGGGPSGGYCGVHRIGDTYAGYNSCSTCTCTQQGEICQNYCSASYSSSPYYPPYSSSPYYPSFSSFSSQRACVFMGCAVPDVGCHWVNQVSENGCVVDCGRVTCDPIPPFQESSSSFGNYCPALLDCSHPPAGCLYNDPIYQNGCVVSCNPQFCSPGYSSSSSFTHVCPLIAVCPIPPQGCYWANSGNPAIDWNTCHEDCGPLICR